MSRVIPWTVLDSRITFADRWLRVRSDRCRTSEGDAVGPYHVIEYPDWVTVVPLTRGSCGLLTVREYRHGVSAVLTGLPGGLVDMEDGSAGRAATRAAQRELREETGYGAGQWESLVTLHPNPSNQTNTAFCYLATDLIPVMLQPSHDIGEALEVVDQDFLGVMAELQRGTLVMHAVHVAALWSAAARIAADRSARFGPLTARLRTFLTGGTTCRPDRTATSSDHPSVGG